MQAGHHQRRREALAGDVGDHQARAARPQLEKVVVVAPHGAGLDATGRAFEREERRRLLGEQLALHLPRQLHLVGGAPLVLDPVRHLLGEPDAVERDRGLARDRGQELLVLARVRILGEARSKDDESRQPGIAPQDRNQAVRL